MKTITIKEKGDFLNCYDVFVDDKWICSRQHDDLGHRMNDEIDLLTNLQKEIGFELKVEWA